MERGTLVNDNVRLVRRLAAGAMGQVWVADHLTLKIQVAVKLMSEKLAAGDEAARERFSEEASAAARIKSPHVVHTHDSGVMADGTPFIVMELLDGESLADRLSREAWLSLAETAHVVVQTAKALHSGHRQGIIHCDIKPENVFLSKTDDGIVVKVLDFGIAKTPSLPDGWQQADSLAGTPQYLSPEHFHGERLDAQADLWALAVVAYRCLTGKQPFNADTLGLIGLKVLKGRVEPPSSVRRDLPPAVDAWFARAFAAGRAERFADAKHMAVALLDLVPTSQQLSGDAWGAASKPDSDTFTPTVTKRAWSSAALGTMVAAIVVVGVIVSLQRGPESAPPSAAPQPLDAEEPEKPANSAPLPSARSAKDAGVAPSVFVLPPRAPSVSSALPPAPKSKGPVKGGEDYGF